MKQIKNVAKRNSHTLVAQTGRCQNKQKWTEVKDLRRIRIFYALFWRLPWILPLMTLRTKKETSLNGDIIWRRVAELLLIFFSENALFIIAAITDNMKHSYSTSCPLWTLVFVPITSARWNAKCHVFHKNVWGSCKQTNWKTTQLSLTQIIGVAS
jgi:hypothetical protein